nr:MAG TPA: Neck appendage protein [Bacteriophage sp.]
MNGDFTLTVKYPISDSGIYQLIQEDMLIKAPTPVLGAQLFRIKKPVENNDHLEITAYHISDDVMQRSITPVSVTSQSCGMALSRMVQNTKTALGDFSFSSDIQDRRTFNTTETETLYSVLLDGKHSIVGTWEGELVRDNFAMTIKKSRGENRGVVITTHKNLKDYQRTKNSQNVVTRIHAKSTFKPEGAEKETTLRVTVDSPLINSYPYMNEKEYENNNAKTVEELQKWAQAKFSNEGIDKVSDAVKIESYELDGQVVHMGDTVNLKSWKHNVDAFKKAIAYEFDALKEEYISLTFDDKAGTGGSRASGGLSSAADAILGVTGTAQEIALEKALQNADLDFDHKAGLLRQEISDGIELARAKAEEVKRELSDTIDQRFSSFDNGPLQEIKRKAIEALQNAGASSLLAQEAKQIGLDSVARLEAFKSQTTSAQTALSADLDVLKRTIANDIHPKQTQAEAEIEKQVEALVQTKKELAGVKSAQATYEETTTRRLSELTNLANGKASKSELTQTAEELASKIASVRVGGRNYIRGTRRMALANGLWTSGTFRPSGVGATKTINVSDSPATGFDKAIRLTSSNARDQIGIAQDRFEIMPGTYTISVWVKGSVGQRVKLQTYWAPDDATGISPDFILKDDKWTYLTFSSERKKAGIVSIGYVYLVNADAGKYLDVLAPQLENGSLATSPKEAPEDTDGQISAVESTFKQRADSLDAGVRSLTEGLRTKADISALNVTAENIRQSVKSLETDTQNKLNQKLSQAEFEVQASSIRQEILNATKDKADKTLVVAEAGKLREEFSKMKVGSRNYAEDYDFSRGLWYYSQGDNSPQDWIILDGEYNVKGTTNTWKQMQIQSKEGSRSSWKGSTSLLDLEVGETYTLSFQGICYSGSSSVWLSLRANRTAPSNPEIMYGNFNLTSSWQTYQVTIPALTKPENFDFWRIILGYNEIGHVAFRKVELTRSSTRIDAGPAPEDGKTDLIAAKATFERTAQGLRTDLSAIQEYVNKDGQRQEALQRYTREESAKQATAVRELVAKDYVGKATYQETVRAIENKFEAITNPQNGSITTRIANYKKSVDGRFADITSLIAGKANQTDFQHVKETSQLYERIIGSNENDISNKVARMALTNQLFQVEVSKNENLKTVQSQLAGSWGVHNKNSVNEIIAGFNLAGRNAGIKAETIRLEGNTLADKLTAIDGYFKRLFVGEGTFATLNADVIRTNSITADKLVFNEALANRMVSNEHITNKLVASRAFVNALKAVTIDASQIVTGTLKGDRIYGGTIRGTEINGTTITGNSRMTIGDNGFLRPTQEGGLQINVPETYSASKGVGVQLLGRELGRIPKGMFIYNSPNWNGGNIIGDNTEDILLTVKGRVSLCNLHNGSPVSGVPIISNFEYQNPIRNLYPIRFIGWDPRSNQLYVDDGTGKSGTWWISVDGSTSDKNLKTNIGDTHYNALDFVQKLMFKEFDWKTDKFGYKKPYTNVGLIAQDVEKIDSSLVYKKGETLALDDFRLLNIALKAIQELALENRKLTHRLENLENERRTA